MLKINLLELEETGVVGDWSFNKSKTRISIRYPNPDDKERGDIIQIPISTVELSAGNWKWNGNADKPTIEQSILINGDDGNGGRKELWHGYLRDGVLETL